MMGFSITKLQSWFAGEEPLRGSLYSLGYMDLNWSRGNHTGTALYADVPHRE